MKIVVLDGYTLNPGDLSWEDLNALGDCLIHDRTPTEQIISRSRDAEILLTNKTILNADSINQLPALKYIGVLATGYNVVDVRAAAKRGIPVTNVPEYGTHSVSQAVFAHILNVSNRVVEHSAGVRQGKWSHSKDFSYRDYPLQELTGKTMGIIGLGRIGSAVASLALAFGMRVLACRHSDRPSAIAGVTLTDLKTLVRESDFVSLHSPLTETNKGFVNAELLALFKPVAFLINTSRGPLIDEEALAQALNSGQLAGAGLDVLSEEPPKVDCPLLSAKNCFITPHIAWATREARERLLKTAVGNVHSFLTGDRQNVINHVK